MALTIAIQRWFLDREKLRGCAIELLRKYGELFTPVTYEELDECKYRLMNTLRYVGRYLKSLTIHTEYQLPLWWNKEFVNQYTNVIKDIINEISKKRDLGINIENVAIEVHSGFGGPKSERRLEPIIDGITKYIEEVSKETSIEITLRVESRGSSAKGKPQAVATIDELERFRSSLEEKLKPLKVLSVIDIPQLITGHKKLKGMTEDETIEQVIDYVKKNAKVVGELHVHWDKHKPLTEKGKEVYGLVVKELIKQNAQTTIVPELWIRVRTNDIIDTIKTIKSWLGYSTIC